MDIPAYVLLSHETALRRRMDMVANNLANLSTAGFKREQPVFGETRSGGAGRSGDESISFVLDYGSVHDATAGAFTATGNPLDVAIAGEGYLAVQRPDGETLYTRAGNLVILADGRLGTAAGLAVLGEGGQPIAIPAGTGALSITRDGTVSGADGNTFGRIAVTVFAPDTPLDPVGDTLFSGEGGRALAAEETRLLAGGLEASNVQPVAETTAMIETLRAYQSSMRMGDALDDLRKRTLDRLGTLRN